MLLRHPVFRRFAARTPSLAAVAALLFCPALQQCGFAQHTSGHVTAAKAATHPGAGAASDTVPVILLSDIHFEPFQDPAKLAQLRTAPIEQWEAILRSPASATVDTDISVLQKACPVRGTDTSWPLLAASLQQAGATQPHPLFVTVSGDLLSHAFDCRFHALAPTATMDEASAFASKTVAFVTAELGRAFPDAPVYVSLGNNDSGCGDYRESPGSAFLQRAGETFAQAARGADNAKAILRDFAAEGDYNIALPPPMHAARLLVLQDMFDSTHVESCANKPEPAAADAQLAWLKSQLDAARAHHEHVWVMAHLPPGIDMYATLSQHRDVCGGKAPAMFLVTETMAETIAAYPDVVALAVFAHTHADELRWLHAPDAGTGNGVAVKLVSSISPVNGNTPTFTVAQVDWRTAVLEDYTVYLIGQRGQPGQGAAASKEYSFRETYKLPSYSAKSLEALTNGFLADAGGSSDASRAYQRLYFPGDTGMHAAAMQLFWHTYACSLREAEPAGFRSCACPAAAADPAK